MNQSNNKTIDTKRDKISRANSMVFVSVAVSAVVVMFCLISIRFLWQKKSYNDRVIGAKTNARKQIEDNISNLDQLTAQFPELQNRASNNSKTILHALPPNYDYAALVTSMEYLAKQAGVKLSSGIGQDESAAAVKEQNTYTPQEIALTLNVSGNYENIVRYISSLERSIRPVLVTTVDFNGTSSDLKASITAKTFYQPVRSLEVSKEVIK